MTCPFCGSDDLSIHESQTQESATDPDCLYKVACVACGADALGDQSGWIEWATYEALEACRLADGR